MSERLVVQVTSLEEFNQEVPQYGGTVRLMATRERIQGGTSGLLRLNLDLTGIGANGEIVWLHDHTHVDLMPGSIREPWTDGGKAVVKAQAEYFALVHTYLELHDYTVRGGRYGISSEIAPILGVFECARWDREVETYVAFTG